MPLEAPNLDNRKFAEIVEDARALIPSYLPEWTDHNLSDPGMTMVQLFAWLTESIIYRLNQVPERNYIKFLQLVGIEQKPAVPATAEITFNLASTALTSVVIPRGTRIGAAPAPASPSALDAPALAPADDEEPIVFETDESLIAIGAPLKNILAFDGVNYLDRTTANGVEGQSFLPFGSRLRANAALYLGFESNNAFPTDEINLTIRAHSDPDDVQAYQCESGTAAPPATLAWEFFDGAYWRALDVIEDETHALTRSGHLYFHGPSKAARSTFGPVADSLYWLRCRLVTFQYDAPPELDAVVTNTVRATAVTTVLDEVIGSSDGGPDQEMFLRHAPVFATAVSASAAVALADDALITSELTKGFLLQVDDGRGFLPWKEVENFLDSGPTDRHYVLNRTTGEVLFGNRLAGAIPLAGLNNILVSSYRYGGGARTNVGVGAIADLQSSIAGVDSAANRWVAEGGQDEESVADTRIRGPQELRARDRAVTLEDFEFLAKQAPGVRIRRAHALPLHHPSFPDVAVPGVITVIVVPENDDPKPLPSESTMKTVCSWLDSRRLLTTEIYVAPPRYKLIRVAATIRARATSNAARVKADTETALTRYLHPLEGGDDGQGWSLGGTVRFSDLFRVVFQVDGVATVDDLRIIIDGQRKGACENAEIPTGYLVYSDGHDISVSVSGSGG